MSGSRRPFPSAPSQLCGFEENPMTEAPLAPERDIDDRLHRCTGLVDLRFDPLEAAPNRAESSDAPGNADLLSAARLVLDPAREGLRR
jgi:hypothetical protein